ncbi:hypothetical protein Pelo_8813 [Pelomyxa schiedti]|nr:hypothetical protein Pelo_8813 [Pelomyxa schiedti]
MLGPSNGQYLRACVFFLSCRTSVLNTAIGIAVHHLCTDLFSAAALFHRIKEAYEGKSSGFTLGTQTTIPYVIWNLHLSTRCLPAVEPLGHWKSLLNGSIMTLNLPFVRGSAASSSFRGSSVSCALGTTFKELVMKAMDMFQCVRTLFVTFL